MQHFLLMIPTQLFFKESRRNEKIGLISNILFSPHTGCTIRVAPYCNVYGVGETAGHTFAWLCRDTIDTKI